MTLHWDDLRTVLELVKHGSLARAAVELHVSYTTVSRRVERAEAALGEKLFERLKDGYRPNETAKLIAEHAGDMQACENALLRKLAGRDDTLSGPLTLTAPQLFIAHVLSPALQRFCALHPNVELSVKATNDVLDLARREADIGVRISREPGDSLNGLRLARQDSASFATRDWAERIEKGRDEPIDWIVYTPHGSLPESVTRLYPNSRIKYRFDDMVAISGAAQQGLGVARMPMFLGRCLPGLVQLPLIKPKNYMDIWLVAHADVWPSAKVKALRNVLVEEMKKQRDVFVG